MKTNIVTSYTQLRCVHQWLPLGQTLFDLMQYTFSYLVHKFGPITILRIFSNEQLANSNYLPWFTEVHDQILWVRLRRGHFFQQIPFNFRKHKIKADLNCGRSPTTMSIQTDIKYKDVWILFDFFYYQKDIDHGIFLANWHFISLIKIQSNFFCIRW